MEDEYEGVGIESLPPICAVAGFFVMNVGAMERTLYAASVTLQIATSFAVAEKSKIGPVIELLQQKAPRLHDGDEFLGHLDAATKAIELRHALVHGFLLYDDESGVFKSHRPKPSAKRHEQSVPEKSIWTSRQFRATDLMEHAHQARAANRFVLERQLSWHEALRPDWDEQGPTDPR